MTAEVTRKGGLDMQVCVPADWTDDEAMTFAEQQYPCGTQHGWQIRRKGDPNLRGAPERAPCHSRTGHVHITLDA